MATLYGAEYYIFFCRCNKSDHLMTMKCWTPF